MPMEVSRRSYMGALAAGATANWEAADYDIENVDEWPDEIGHNPIGSFTPSGFRSSGELGFSGFLVENEDVETPTTEVWYDRDGVNVALEAGLEAGNYAGSGAEFDPDEARDLAIAIYQAAEEIEKWRGAIDDE